MSTKTIGIIVAVVIVCSGASFYGGTLYQRSHTKSFASFASGAAQGQGRFSRTGQGASNTTRSTPTAGTIVSKDATSLTIQLASGGSKIAFYTGSTTVMQTTQSSVASLNVGDQVMIQGSANSDGSITAVSIQSGTDMSRFNGTSSTQSATQTR